MSNSDHPILSMDAMHNFSILAVVYTLNISCRLLGSIYIGRGGGRNFFTIAQGGKRRKGRRGGGGNNSFQPRKGGRGRSSITAVAGPASAWTWWEPIRPIAGVEWSQFLASTDASHRALPAHVCHPSAACVSQSLQLGEVL